MDPAPLITAAPAAPTTGTSQPLAGDALSSRTLGDTPAAGAERVTDPVAPASGEAPDSGAQVGEPSALDPVAPPGLGAPAEPDSPAEPGAAAEPDAPAEPHTAAAAVAAPEPVTGPATPAVSRWSGEELDEIELTRLRTPATGIAPVPHALRLVFDTGERVDVEGEGVVGRAPQGSVAHVIAIDDPARSLSKTHLSFGPAGPGELWLVDRGSTNGTVVVRPDGAAATLPPGMRAVVTVGWSLRLGERTVRVEGR